jgi:hypothetical protein
VAAENQVCLVGIAGGDPFLFPHTKAVLEKIIALRMRPLIAGNPSVEFEKNLSLLTDLAIPTVQFSLDSYTQLEHDEVRGVGSYAQTINMIEKLTKRGINVNLSVCITRLNCNNIAEVIPLAERIGIYKLKLVFWQEDNASLEFKHSFSSAEKQIILKKIAGASSKRSLRDWVIVPGFDLETLDEFAFNLPELIIHSDGTAAIGESGLALGNIKDTSIDYAYSKYVAEEKLAHLKNIFIGCVDRLGITVELVYKKMSNGAGSVLRINSDYYIFIDNTLPQQYAAIIALHELGHIATNTLTESIVSMANDEYEKGERLANSWVVEQLVPFIPNLKDRLVADYASDRFYEQLSSEVHSNYCIF